MEHPSDQAQPQSEPGLKERFYRQFQQDVAALHEKIERLSTATGSTDDGGKTVDDCLAGIDGLSHLVKDASSYLPAYDRRAYSDSVKALSEKLQKIRSEAAPTKKFQFRSTRKTAPQPTPDSPRQTQMPAADMLSEAPKREQQAAPSDKQTMDISNQFGAHIRLQASDCPIPGSATLTNLNRCVVNLSQPTNRNSPYSGLILKDIKNSLIVCGYVEGPVHMTWVKNCVLLMACRQFRMHASEGVDVYLHCASRPIIEDCKAIRFAPFPDAFVTPAILGSVNHWDQIDDFKWLKLEPSPHFSFLDKDQWIGKELWEDIAIGDGNGVSLVDGVLLNSKILPHPD